MYTDVIHCTLPQRRTPRIAYVHVHGMTIIYAYRTSYIGMRLCGADVTRTTTPPYKVIRLQVT